MTTTQELIKLFEGKVQKYGDSFFIRIPMQYIHDGHFKISDRVPIYREPSKGGLR